MMQMRWCLLLVMIACTGTDGDVLRKDDAAAPMIDGPGSGVHACAPDAGMCEPDPPLPPTTGACESTCLP